MSNAGPWLLRAALAASALLAIPREAKAISCIAGPFIVFFERDEEALTAPARTVLDTVVKAYETCGIGGRVLLAGHSDRSGSSARNLSLSRQRAQRVRAYLAAHGVPVKAMIVVPFGESRPLVETPDGVQERSNRRVEITFGPGEDR